MFPCEIKTMSAQPTVATRFRSALPDLPTQFSKAYGEVMRYLSDVGAEAGVFAYAKYNNMDMQNLDVEAGFPVYEALASSGEIVASEIPAGTYAICHYKGPYAETNKGYDELMRYMNEHGYAPGGPFYEWYLNGPDLPPQDLKTDLVVTAVRVTEHAAT